MAPAAYSPKLLAHFRDPVNPGCFPPGTDGVFRGEAGSAAAGRLVRIELRLASDGTIGEARFQAFGCPATIASASFAVSRIGGQTPSRAAALSADEICAALALPDHRREAGELCAAAVRAATETVP